MDSVEKSHMQSSIRVISIGFSIIILLVILIASMGVKENKNLAKLNDQMFQHPFSVSIAVLEANNDIIAMHRYMKDVVLANNKDELNLAISQTNYHERKVYQHFKLIKERFLGDKEKINVAYQTFVDWKPIRDKTISLKLSNQHRQAANITKGKGAKHIKNLSRAMALLTNFAHNKALEFKESSQRSYDSNKVSSYIFLVFTVFLSVVTAVFVIFWVKKAEQARKESEDRFIALYNNAQISIWSEDISLVVTELENIKQQGVEDLKTYLYANIDLAWKLTRMVKINSVNKSTLKLFGAKSQAEFINRIDKTFGSNAIEVFINELDAIWSKQKSFHSEVNFKTLDGKKIRALISFQIPTLISDFQNIPITIVDITEQKLLEKKLKLSARVFSDTQEGIMITNADKFIVDVNPAFEEITGYSREEVIGNKPNILSSHENNQKLYENMWLKINHQGHWQGEIENCKKCGETYIERLAISSLKNTKGQVVNYLGMFSDITESKRQQDIMRKMAHYDALTGLANRTLLLDRFSQAIAHSKRSGTMLAVCFLDLDDFKPVNDTFGHDIGDKVLIDVAHRLTSVLRAEDTVSRLGGDEFAMLLGGIESKEQCHVLLDRIIHNISKTYLVGEHAIKIGASIGFSLSPLSGIELDSLLRQADQAMYQVKQQGKKNYQIFDIEQSKKVAQKHTYLQEIQHGLTNNEFVLHYQPKVNMTTGKVIGVEALIRWVHPEKGMIPPLDFLPLFEGTELEIQVGDWVIEQGLTQLGLLNAQGINLEMSVNVSSMQFLHVNFYEKLKNALCRHPNIEPKSFQLEVLESSTLGDLQRISKIITLCRQELNVNIALDDFGTGYSSLSHLRQLPADTIKIDQSFVRDILLDPDDYAIVTGVVDLSKSFNRNVIAEGVETPEHGLMLLLMGCKNAQGYAISKPMPANELANWVLNYNPNKAWMLCGSQNMTPQLKRVTQFELIVNQMIEDIKRHAQANSEHNIDISNISENLKQWFVKIIREQLFDEEWLKAFQNYYNHIHQLAKNINGSHQPTAENVSELLSIFYKILSVLQKYKSSKKIESK